MDLDQPATHASEERGADAQLVARCRTGDERAWTELVQRFSRYVYAIAVRVYRLGDHDAEDVFQEAFARTYENLEHLREDSAIRPWLAQTTRRLSIDRLRAAAHEEPVEHELGVEDCEDPLARLEDALVVQEALAQLPDDCREVLDRFFCRDQSYRTISTELELPPGTIASRISRCLVKLRADLEGRE